MRSIFRFVSSGCQRTSTPPSKFPFLSTTSFKNWNHCYNRDHYQPDQNSFLSVHFSFSLQLCPSFNNFQNDRQDVYIIHIYPYISSNDYFLHNKKPAPNGVGLGRWKTHVFKSRVSSEFRAFTTFAKNAVFYAFEAPREACAL